MGKPEAAFVMTQIICYLLPTIAKISHTFLVNSFKSILNPLKLKRFCFDVTHMVGLHCLIHIANELHQEKIYNSFLGK